MKYAYSVGAILFACGAAYLIYARCFQGIDGLPPLPDEMLADSQTDARRADTKQGHGTSGLEDLEKMPLQIEVNSKNLRLGCEECDFLTDGRARIRPFLLAIFGKDPGPGKLPEINTVKGDVAFLTFDQPVKNLAEIGKRRIVGGELQGIIHIRNNRGTAAQDDDLSLTTPGPVYYREDHRRVWTTAPVRILDTQDNPQPTTITAEGFDLVLAAEKAAAPGRNKGISGVDSFTLRANVEMHLIDSNPGFLGEGEPDDPNAGRAKLVITTPGPVRYDVATGRARFEVPTKRGPFPAKVTVTRRSGPPGQEKHEFLHCDRLDLQFQRERNGLAIQEAHATGREVELISEGEGLHAIGNDFFFNAAAKVSAINGTPAMGLREGNETRDRGLDMTKGKNKRE